MSGFAPGALRGFYHFTLTQPKDGADTEGQVGEFPEAPARGAKAEAEGGLPGAPPGERGRRGRQAGQADRLLPRCGQFLRGQIPGLFSRIWE